MPKTIKKLSTGTIDTLSKLSFQEIALAVTSTLLDKYIPKSVLRKMIKNAFFFPCPLRQLDEKLFVLELFHGPTLSFKDFGARFMAELFSYFGAKEKKQITILTATSGDTGSAVAKAFYKKLNTKVVVLYPKNKISKIQEKQIATLGENIIAVAVKGNFDDCQKLVKTAFQDKKLSRRFNLTSANSINIARLIPQTLYYFWGYAQLKTLYHKPYTLNPIFVVPSGNFGNLTAGLIAKRMGLPVQFIAATNENDIIPQYLKTGQWNPLPSKQTLSNAMDVGNPSNWARIMDLYNHNLIKIKKDLTAISVSDIETKKIIKIIYKKYNYVIDPHTAVGLATVLRPTTYNSQPITYNLKPKILIVLATAHPAKFPEIVEKIIHPPKFSFKKLGGIKSKISVPHRLAKCLKKSIKSITIEPKITALKNVLSTYIWRIN